MGAPLAVAYVVMIAVQGVAQAYGARQQGRYQAAVMTRNAQLAGLMARDVRRLGREEEAVASRAVGAIKGRQQAAVGASGAAVGQGTAAEIVADTAMLGRLEALRIRNDTLRRSFGLEVGASNLLYEAALTRKAGSTQALTGLVGTAASTIGAGYQSGLFKR